MFLFGAGAATLGLATYAGTHARHELEVTERTFPIVDLPDPFVGMRLVQISDLHTEEFTEPWFLKQVVDRINQINPDMVLITGDFVSRGPAPRRVALRAAGVAAELLSEIRAPRVAILGNHDVGVGADWVVHELELHGTPVLIDSYLPVRRAR